MYREREKEREREGEIEGERERERERDREWVSVCVHRKGSPPSLIFDTLKPAPCSMEP